MNIYLVESGLFNYDTYDSFVCIAESEDEARNLDPNGNGVFNWEKESQNLYSSWVSSPDALKVTCLGTSNEEKARIILASFNAG